MKSNYQHCLLLSILSLTTSLFSFSRATISKPTDVHDNKNSIDTDANIEPTQPCGFSKVAVIPTDNNLNINSPVIISVGRSFIDPVICNIIFDQNSAAIGFPEDMFSNVISYLQLNANISCESITDKPPCYYEDEIGSLPNITISVFQQKINIPPQIYIQDYTEHSAIEEINPTLHLNIKKTNPDITDNNQITTTFNNNIILGSNFFDYYQVIFDNSSRPEIILYEPRSSDNNSTNSSTTADADGDLWIYMLSISVVLDLLICGFCCCSCKKKRNRNRVNTRPPNENQGYPSGNTALLGNQQFIDDNLTTDDEHEPETANPRVDQERLNLHWVSYYDAYLPS